MTKCFFVSDLHGRVSRYETLLHRIRIDGPEVVFVGGDLLPPFGLGAGSEEDGEVNAGGFVPSYLHPQLSKLRAELGANYPRILVIMGNDDSRAEEFAIEQAADAGLLEYIHKKRVAIGEHFASGYSYIPPTPFALKDWEKYDVSRFIDPGCISPEAGTRTLPTDLRSIRFSTIADDLRSLKANSMEREVFLFHAPPYRTALDRAALDGHSIDHVPLDVHVGSIAISRFITESQPHLTMHGHVHESASITGEWQDRLGRTVCLSGAHDGPELSLVRFDLEDPSKATRELI